MSLPNFTFDNLNTNSITSKIVNSANISNPIIQTLSNDNAILKADTDILKDDTAILKDDTEALKDETDILKDDTAILKRFVNTENIIKISSPGDLDTLRCWVDASDEFSIEITGGKVTKVYDKSGNNNNFIEGALTGTVNVNNITYIEKDTVNDSTLSNIGLLDFNLSIPLVATLPSAIPESFCYFLVYQIKNNYPYSPTQTVTLLFGRSTNSALLRQNIFHQANSINGLSGSINNTGINGLGEQQSRKIILMLQSEGTTSTTNVYLNGAFVFKKANMFKQANTIHIGSDLNTNQTNTLNYNGYIAELGLYNRNLSDNEMVALHKYLADKWNVYDTKIVDYFTIAGQSNAAGRGNSAQSPLSQSGYYIDAYWANNPSAIINWIRDPVGVNGVTLDAANTGSAWPAFADEYFKQTGRYAVFGHCAKGGSSIFNSIQWSPTENKENNYINDLKEVCISNTARIGKEYRFQLGKKFVIWHQGESDEARTKDEYKEQFKLLINEYVGEGKLYDKFLYYEIAPRTGNPHSNVRTAQKEVNKEVEDAHLIWNGCSYFLEKGVMPDGLHYDQGAYNAMGREGAKTAAIIVKSMLI
jgi:hypothetical protein